MQAVACSGPMAHRRRRRSSSRAVRSPSILSPARLCGSSEVEVEPTCDRLHLNVVIDDVYRNAERGRAVVVLTAEVYVAVLETEANIARDLVLKAGAGGPSVPPFFEGKTVGPYGVPSRHVHACASPTGFCVHEPLPGCDTQTAGDGDNPVNVGVVRYRR
jgi:hypothetical protein